jgi:hypothetical protein
VTLPLHLVSVYLDPRTEGRLEQVWVSGGYAVPAKCVEKGREALRCIETLCPQILPALVLQNSTIEFLVPKDFEHLTLSVIVGTRQANYRGLIFLARPKDLLN